MRLYAALCLLFVAAAVNAGDAGIGKSFEGPLGLQLYSLRAEFMANGVPATLDKVKAFGFTNVELAGTYNMAPDKFLALLQERGLKAVSGHFPYDRYKNEPEKVAAEAKALGLQYAGCAWISHKAPFDEAQCRATAEVFNKAGEALKKEGITFFYHCHGFEFYPHAEGTLWDLLMKETKPELVSYQMDVLWVVFPGQDPAKLLEKYPNRWVSMHLKDLKKGVALGSLKGGTDVRNDVVLGTGQTDWPAVLKAAKKAGVKYYFIEDESPDVKEQIPLHMKYLEGVEF